MKRGEIRWYTFRLPDKRGAGYVLKFVVVNFECGLLLLR